MRYIYLVDDIVTSILGEETDLGPTVNCYPKDFLDRMLLIEDDEIQINIGMKYDGMNFYYPQEEVIIEESLEDKTDSLIEEEI